MERRIRDWYVREFPGDDLGNEINGCATFRGLFDVLDQRKSVYGYLGVVDSVVREFVFRKLAELMGVDYGYVYDQWLLAEEG